MKLVIQIPCYNEAKTLPLVFENLPRTISGVEQIEYYVIDDGSTDNTAEVAAQLGAHQVIRIKGKNRRWLGRAFQTGVDHALANGADILVNTDGDNQYPSERISELVRPILDGSAQVVIGDRNPGSYKGFSPVKRLLQRMGSSVVQLFTRQRVPDAVSGFRAYSREALFKIHPITNYTYTVDTLMQAHEKGLDVQWLEITPNPKTRESRLITSLMSKVRRSGTTILRMVAVYRPFKTFLAMGVVFFVPGLILLGRFLFYYFLIPQGATGKIQSVVVGGVLLVISVQFFMLGLIGDLLAVNRTHIEELLTRIRRLEAKNSD